jgi:hypothetical protein
VDIQGIGTLLLGMVGVYNAVQSTLARRAASRASGHANDAALAVTALGSTVRELEINTNSKMDTLIAAKEAVADLTGEKRGIVAGVAQEVARQKEQT